MALSDLTPTQRRFLETFVLEKPLPAASAPLDAKALATVRQVQAALSKLAPRAAALIKDEADKLARATAQIARYEAAGDLDSAARELATTLPLARATERHLAELRRYLAEADGFAKRLAEARRLKGAGGIIDDYVARMESDEAQRKRAEARGDFDTAVNACRAEESVHSSMLREAEQARDFNAVRDATRSVLARLAQGQADAGLRDAMEAAEATLTSAQGFGDGGNWSAALAIARQAQNDLTRAEAAAALRRKAAAEGLEASEKLCRGLLRRYRKSPGASALKPQISAASDQVDAARAALPDDARALQLMSEAVAACTALDADIARARRCAEALERLLARHKTISKLNTDNCVAPELAAAEKSLRQAARLAKAARFEAAVAPLSQAQKALEAAAAAAQLYRSSVRNGRRSLAKAIGSADAASEAAQPLRKAFDDLSAAFAARDLARAARLAAAADRLA